MALICRIIFSVLASIALLTKARFSMPMPCSPDKVPFNVNTQSKTSVKHCSAC